MKCPVCVDTDLVMADRQSVEIDYCPKCRGVWLERGELDKIIQRSGAESTTIQPQPDPYQGYGREGHHGGHRGKGYRRKSWLSEIFD